MNKHLTQEQIEEIKKSYKKGNITIRDLAKKFGIAFDSVRYHISEDYKIKKRAYRRERYNKLSSKEKTDLYLRRKEYTKVYMRNKYRNDPDFRERQKERARNYKRKKNE